jgi:arylsulfatase A-like enzyme
MALLTHKDNMMKFANLLVCCLALCLPVFAQTPATHHPNVLFILIDDLGWMDLGYQGSKTYETPQIDKLAYDGVRFSQAHAAYPLCLPSRLAIQTGQNPARFKRPGHGALDRTDVTMAKAFKESGYVTFFAGKWHLSHGKDTFPEDAGYDINMGGGHAGEPGSYFFPYGLGHGLEEGAPGEYITDRLTDETIAFIRNHKDKPFFAFLSHYAVHTPRQAKPGDIAYYKKKIETMKFNGPDWEDEGTGRTKLHQDNAIYAAMLHSLDENVGRLVDELKNLGLYDNTIIVFTSDNGGLSNHGYTPWDMSTSNQPLRAGKGHFYEGGSRVPTFVHWPEASINTMESEAIVNGTDFFPTLLEMCGLPPRPEEHKDGRSFVWAMRGEKDPDPNRMIFWHNPRCRPHSIGDNNLTTALQGRYKFMDHYDLGTFELYDLSEDRSETTDISAHNPERCDMFKRKIQTWRTEVDAIDNVDPSNPYQFIPRNGAFEYGNTQDWSLEVSGSAKARQELSGREEGHNLSYHPQYNAYKLVVEKTGKPSDVAITGSWHDRIGPETQLTLSCYARAIEPGQSFQLELTFNQSDGAQVVQLSEVYKLTDQYKEYAFHTVPPDTYEQFRIRLHAGAHKGITYFDYVCLAPTDCLSGVKQYRRHFAFRIFFASLTPYRRRASSSSLRIVFNTFTYSGLPATFVHS